MGTTLGSSRDPVNRAVWKDVVAGKWECDGTMARSLFPARKECPSVNEAGG